MSEKKDRISRFQDVHSDVESQKRDNLNQQDDSVIEMTNVSSSDLDNKIDLEIAVEQSEFAEEMHLEEDNGDFDDEEVVFETNEVISDEVVDRPGDTTMLNELVSIMDKDDSYLAEEEKQEDEEINLIVKEVLGNMEEPLVVSDDPLKVPMNKAITEGKFFGVDDDESLDDEKAKKFKWPKFGKKKENVEVIFDDNSYVDDGNGKSKSTWKYKFGIGFFTFCNICALICFFVAYGPFNYVRDLFVTTAMGTMTHKYLANVLYSTETIQEILANNVTLEPNEIMDESAIKIGNIKETDVYSSIYEEMVLKKNEGNDLYKVVKLNEHGYKGYVVFVYDPTKIELAVTKNLGSSGEYVTSMAKRTKAHVAINGGGFLDAGGVGTGGYPAGYVIKNGKIVWTRKRGGSWKGGTIGFNKEGVLMLLKERGNSAIKKGVYNGVDFGPFLIVNGKSGEVKGNGGWGIHPRTVIGQRQDGIVVMLIIDGRQASSLGVDLNVAIDIMERFNVYNAANLDGGASTVLAIEGKLINNPVAWSASGERGVPTAWVVVDK